MALTYRTPMEDIVSSFDPAVQSAIASTAASGYKAMEEINFNIANYHLNAFAKQRLSSAGIYLSPYSAVVHSHPVCKTLENHLLYIVLPPYLNNKFCFVSIKSGKLSILKKRNANLSLINSLNRYVTSADKVRYSNEFVVRSSLPHQSLYRHSSCLADSTLRDLVPHLMKMGSKYLFLHDELHYWTKRDLTTFLEVMQPETLLATVVIPPELLIGATHSLNPWCYEFEICKNKILFYPDGERAEGYEQPLKCVYLLKTNKIILQNGDVYCLDIICSKYAHHLISITKGDSLVNSIRSFGRFEAVSIGALSDISNSKVPFIPVNCEIVSKMYRYLESLKKPDSQSAMAKLSQLVENPSCHEIKFVQEFASLVIATDKTESMILPQRLKIFLSKMYRRILPKWLAEKIESVRECSLDDFIRGLKPLSFNVHLNSIKYNDVELDLDLESLMIENDYDLVNSLEGKFNGESSTPLNRAPCPYQSLEAEELKPQSILELDRDQIVLGFARLYINSFLNSQTRKVSRSLISDFIKVILLNKVLVGNISLEINLGSPNSLVSSIISKIKALMVRHIKPMFLELGSQWFISYNRLNQIYIEDKPHNTQGFKEISSPWALIVKDIISRGPHKTFIERIKKEEKLEVKVALVDSPADLTCSCNILTRHSLVGQEITMSPIMINLNESGLFFSKTGDVPVPQGFKKFHWNNTIQSWLNQMDSEINYNICMLQSLTIDDNGQFESGLDLFSGARVIYNVVGTSIIQVPCLEGDHNIMIAESHLFEYIPKSSKSQMPLFKTVSKNRVALVFFEEVIDHSDSVSSGSTLKVEDKKTEYDSSDGNEVQDKSKDLIAPQRNNDQKLTLFVNKFQFDDQLRGRMATFFSRDNESYSYNGGKHKSKGWPVFLNEIIQICNYNPNHFNHCLVQKYSIGGKIGFHSDDEQCYPLSNPILTVNMKGRASFGILDKKTGMSTFFELDSGDYFLMGFNFQRDFKHSVKSLSDGRVSLTFRSTRLLTEVDFLSGPTILPSDVNNEILESIKIEKPEENKESLIDSPSKLCFLKLTDDSSFVKISSFSSISDFLLHQFDLTLDQLNQCLKSANKLSLGQLSQEESNCLEEVGLDNLLLCFKFTQSYPVEINLIGVKSLCMINIKSQTPIKSSHFIRLQHGCNFIDSVLPANICTLHAISECLGRNVYEVIAVVEQDGPSSFRDNLYTGKGIKFGELETLLNLFSIIASIRMGSDIIQINPSGTFPGFFELSNNHLTFIPKHRDMALMRPKVVSFELKFVQQVMSEVLSCSSNLMFKVSRARAACLADSFHAGSTGVILSELFNSMPNFKEVMDKDSEPKKVKVHCILGTFGSGKSTFFRRLCAQGHGRKFDVVSPRKALLNDIAELLNFQPTHRLRKKQGQENWKLSTFETFLKRAQFLSAGQMVFIDEIQLYPPGYLDLIFSLNKVEVNWVLLGDPCQSDYHSDKDFPFLGNLPSNVESLLRGNTYNYNILSRRFRNSNFVSRLPCSFATDSLSMQEPYDLREGLEQLTNLESHYQRVILVSSFEEKKIVGTYCPKANLVLTFGESTGLTFDYGTILITLIAERSSEKRWVTALSRFRKNICLINSTGYSLDSLLTSYKNRFLFYFLTGTANSQLLIPHLPGNPNLVEGFLPSSGKDELDASLPPMESSVPLDPSINIGRDEGVREEKLLGDPWLKSMIDLFQLEDIQEIEMQEVEEALVNFKIHLPREEMESTRARWVHRILAKEFREVRFGSIVSNQFTDDHSKQVGGMQLTNAAERFETIYPRHRANDTVTFLMAVKKRLRFSKPHIEKAKLNMARPFGRFMLNTFLEKVPLKPNRDLRMFEKARQDFFDKKTAKSAATIENHNMRSCRDWLIDMAQIFSKSQLCTKFDNRFRVAKAAQSIVCFQHSVLCRFAPYMRYIEMKLKEALPERFYIHSGKGLDELNAWVIKNKFDGVCTESDYEAFDASQDQYMVAFELEIMRYLGLPNDVLQDYEYIKTHLGSKLGSFAIMRFTGEASTFLFNTMANMLFTFLRYNLKGNESICFAGDDMCSSKRLSIKKDQEGFLSKIKLKAKVQHTANPTFCGWHLSPYGIFKKPQLVFERMCIAKELNNLHNCIDNYAIEVSYAYRKGELISSRMDEEELGAYYGCVRTIIKYKHLLKSDVRLLFEESLD
nr:replicase [Cucumber vein-clearing virus]